jgi:hypothetical protein
MADLGALDSRRPAAPADFTAQTGAIHLNRGKVIRLEKNSDVKTVEIIRGIVWLTGTPAKGDLLLRAGDRFELRNNWPYVIQALEGAELTLVQAGQPGKDLTLEFDKPPAESVATGGQNKTAASPVQLARCQVIAAATARLPAGASAGSCQSERFANHG